MKKISDIDMNQIQNILGFVNTVVMQSMKG